MKTNDIQTVAMLLSEASQHDANITPIANTMSRRTNRVSRSDVSQYRKHFPNVFRLVQEHRQLLQFNKS
jgi:hypothetical protein